MNKEIKQRKKKHFGKNNDIVAVVDRCSLSKAQIATLI
jgi:hypothetical protein